MSLEDFTPSESIESGANAVEVSERLKEAIKRGTAGIKRTQKDEGKAKKHDMLLAGFLVKIIIDKKYDFILDSLFRCLDKGFSSNLILGILSLIHEDISKKIKTSQGKNYNEFIFSYDQEMIFNDNTVDQQIKARINSWVEDISDTITLDYSSIQTNELKKKFISEQKNIVDFTAKVFKFFLHNSNITIQDTALFSISEFILGEVEKSLNNLEVEEI